MLFRLSRWLPILLPLAIGVAPAEEPVLLPQRPSTLVKRSPLKDGPVSPGMGYETSLGYDPAARRSHRRGSSSGTNPRRWRSDGNHS
jgi:hypothetical protein